MAQLTSLGRIQTSMGAKHYIKDVGDILYIKPLDQSPTNFYQVSEEDLSGACLLATCDLGRVVKVEEVAYQDTPTAHKVVLVNAPCTLHPGYPLATDSIDDSMLFNIKKLDNGYMFESKKYSNSVLGVYNNIEKNPICCLPLKSSDRKSQVFLCLGVPKI